MNRNVAFAVRSALRVSMALPLALLVPTAYADDTPLEEVIVTGIRHSVEASLQEKKKADSLVDIVSAEDVGKMPDKNVADSLQRIPGLTVSSAGASEGGFDENDRVSMRGTNPSLTQTLINGHNVAAGDWFVLNQTNTIGRSVSYTLLPSELISKVVVHKSSQADLVEGGVAGSVDIITRKPLDFSNKFTFEASAGTVYSDLPDKAAPQFSGLIAFKDAENTIGVMLQGFYEKRYLQREGVEELGYEAISPDSAVAAAHPDLANVVYPLEIGETLFTQTRTRTGGMLDIQVQPLNNLSFDLSAFLSQVDAPNFNRNYMIWNTHFIAAGTMQGPDPGYQVVNGTLVSANFSGVPGTFYGVYDQISRPEESESSSFVNLDASWKVSDRFDLFFQGGLSEGHGKTPTQDVAEVNFDQGNGAAYTLHGIGSGPSFSFGSTDNSSPFAGGTPVAFNWIFGAQNIDVVDKENWAKLDGTFAANAGPLTDVKLGARWETHDRSSLGVLAQGPASHSTYPDGSPVLNPDGTPGSYMPASDPTRYPQTWSNYPSDFENFGGSIPASPWYWTPAQLAAYNNSYNVNRDPLTRAYIANGWYALSETNYAAYIQANFSGTNWSGNVGVRWVQTGEDTLIFSQNDPSVTALTPGAVLTSDFGPYISHPESHTYNNVLPSFNFKYNLSPSLIARLAVAKTMARADYSALSGVMSLGATPSAGSVGNGSAGNPSLKPILSTNYDLGMEWYFSRRSLVSATLFYMDLDNYVGFGSRDVNVLSYSSDFPNGQLLPYRLTVPVNTQGRVKGVEVAYQQALTDNIGLQANYTYTDARQTSGVQPNIDGSPGDDRLVGASKTTYNVSAYYENAHFNARVAYNYRSSFFSGLDRNSAFSQAAIGYLSASLGYVVNDNLSFTFDGRNLNNPILKYYGLNTAQPRAFYINGRQYYLSVRVKF